MASGHSWADSPAGPAAFTVGQGRAALAASVCLVLVWVPQEDKETREGLGGPLGLLMPCLPVAEYHMSPVGGQVLSRTQHSGPVAQTVLTASPLGSALTLWPQKLGPGGNRLNPPGDIPPGAALDSGIFQGLRAFKSGNKHLGLGASGRKDPFSLGWGLLGRCVRGERLSGCGPIVQC